MINYAMTSRTSSPAPAGHEAALRIHRLFRRARKAAPTSEDEALNALCDARLKDQRYPLSRLLKKLGHELGK
jgi:hypothetical protein